MSLAGLEQSIEAPTDKEKILIRGCPGRAGTRRRIPRTGESALYDPAAEISVPEQGRTAA